MSTPVSPSFKIIGGDGKEYGPIDLATLQQWAREGRLVRNSQVWDSRTGAWQTAAEVPELAAVFGGAAAPPPISSVPPPLPPAGMALAEQVLQRGYDVDIGDWFSEAWALYKANFGFVLGAFWLVTAISLLGAMPYVGFLISLVIEGPLAVGLWSVLLKKKRGQPTDIGQVFDGFRFFFLQSFLAYLVTTVLVMVGILCCLLPAIYLGVAYTFAFPLVVDRRMDFWQAMETSRRVVTRQWFLIFVFVLLVGLLSMAGVLACCVGIIITAPFGICGTVVAYEHVFGPPTDKPPAPISGQP